MGFLIKTRSVIFLKLDHRSRDGFTNTYPIDCESNPSLPLRVVRTGSCQYHKGRTVSTKNYLPSCFHTHYNFHYIIGDFQNRQFLIRRYWRFQILSNRHCAITSMRNTLQTWAFADHRLLQDRREWVRMMLCYRAEIFFAIISQTISFSVFWWKRKRRATPYRHLLQHAGTAGWTGQRGISFPKDTMNSPTQPWAQQIPNAIGWNFV